MKKIRITSCVADDGSIILPPGVLESMGKKPGDMLQMAILTPNPFLAANDYVVVSSEKITEADLAEPAEKTDFRVPYQLLQEAGIPMDAKLSIRILPGIIMAGTDEAVLMGYAILKLREAVKDRDQENV